tara:strand:+ start:2454 stop:3596 length:1143 start_codon:yes stop_codon:yes gene_type:complete
MKLLVITGYAPSLINFRSHLLKALIKHDINITAISRFSKTDTDIKEKLRFIGIEFLPIYISHKIKNPILELFSIICIGFRIIQIKPDTVFVYSPKPIIYTGIITRLIKKLKIIKKFKVVALITGLGYTFSSFENKKLYSLLIIKLAKFGFKKLDKLIFQNSDDRIYLDEKNILSNESQIFRVNGSGVDLNYYSYYPKEEKKEKVFLMLSRLLIDKGILEYINAAKEIKKRYPNVIFNLAGMPYEGSRAINIKDIKAWADENIINYLGLLKDVKDDLVKCDFYVLPSFYKEGIPRSLMEAMAIGRPIITTDSTGCRECIINNINGYMVKPRDYKSLYKAMEKMIIQENSITKRMGLQSRIMAEEKFNVDEINNKMIKILKV